MLEQFFEQIHLKRSQELASQLEPWPRNNPVASDIGKCTRETALSILHWKERPPFDERLAARLKVGSEKENLAIATLLTYGVKIVEQQSNFELKDKRNRVILRGRIDGKMEVDGKRVPFDYKTINPMIFPKLNTLQDLLDHKFFCKYPKQLWAYEYMNNIDVGFIWMDNLLGEWKFIEIPMDWQAMEDVLKQCETAVDAVAAVKTGLPEAEFLPPYHGDSSVCLSCVWFKRLCNPPFFSGEGMQLINDPELEQKLNRRAELDPLATEYDHLDKDLKEVLKASMKPEQVFVVGNWMIKAEEKKRNFKAQPAKPASSTTYLGFDIEKIQGNEEGKNG